MSEEETKEMMPEEIDNMGEGSEEDGPLDLNELSSVKEVE